MNKVAQELRLIHYTSAHKEFRADCFGCRAIAEIERVALANRQTPEGKDMREKVAKKCESLYPGWSHDHMPDGLCEDCRPWFEFCVALKAEDEKCAL